VRKGLQLLVRVGSEQMEVEKRLLAASQAMKVR
jgi:hypothetical protein